MTAVSYSGTMTGQLVGQDLQYLVRKIGTGVRIDIPGLKAGTYSLTVTAGGVTYRQGNIQVSAYDRSGYAHWNYTEGVGAYNDDGTLKANATVLYVTEENKDTVSVTAGGLTVSGIGNILNTSGKEKSGGLTSKGGVANTNGGILEKLASENRPLVVRIVGYVTKPQGVTAWGSIDYGGNTDDNGGMCNMSSCKNITIEGIGADAVVDGWGFAMNTTSGDYDNGYGKNFEFRNITFKMYRKIASVCPASSPALPSPTLCSTPGPITAPSTAPRTCRMPPPTRTRAAVTAHWTSKWANT